MGKELKIAIFAKLESQVSPRKFNDVVIDCGNT